jgi:hypothetical protein
MGCWRNHFGSSQDKHEPAPGHPPYLNPDDLDWPELKQQTVDLLGIDGTPYEPCSMENLYYCGFCGKHMPLSHFPHERM